MTIEEAFEKRHEILMTPARSLLDPQVAELVAAAENALLQLPPDPVGPGGEIKTLNTVRHALEHALTPFRRR